MGAQGNRGVGLFVEVIRCGYAYSCISGGCTVRFCESEHFVIYCQMHTHDHTCTCIYTLFLYVLSVCTLYKSLTSYIFINTDEAKS